MPSGLGNFSQCELVTRWERFSNFIVLDKNIYLIYQYNHNVQCKLWFQDDDIRSIVGNRQKHLPESLFLAELNVEARHGRYMLNQKTFLHRIGWLMTQDAYTSANDESTSSGRSSESDEGELRAEERNKAKNTAFLRSFKNDSYCPLPPPPQWLSSLVVVWDKEHVSQILCFWRFIPPPE